MCVPAARLGRQEGRGPWHPSPPCVGGGGDPGEARRSRASWASQQGAPPGAPSVCRVVRAVVGWLGVRREGPGGARPPYTGRAAALTCDGRLRSGGTAVSPASA